MAKLLGHALASSSADISTTSNTNVNTQHDVKQQTSTNAENISRSNLDSVGNYLVANALPLQDVDSMANEGGDIDDDYVSSNPKYSFTTTTTKTTIIESDNYMPFPASVSASPVPADIYNKTLQAQLLEAERARIRAEFFATYDVMTGVRIAATLGGFFGLMVFLIVWKSRSSSNETMKVLKDPKMAAVAAVCMQEEEEREIQEAMVATGMSIYPDEYDAIVYRRQRMLSLGNVSAPPMLNRGFRFSSVGGGGYSSLLQPPRRFSLSSTTGAMSIGGSSYAGSRRRSCSETSRIFSNYPMGSSFGTDDYFIETDDELENGMLDQGDNSTPIDVSKGTEPKLTDSTQSKPGFLQVPLTGPDSRRSSAMTCCSTDSSYLERRYSAYTLGMRNLPPALQRKPSTASRTSSTDNWDYYYPDIQVIQATPMTSPCPSERNIYDQVLSQAHTQAIKTTTQSATITTPTKLQDMMTSKTAKSTTILAPHSTTTHSTSASGIHKGSLVATNNFIRKHSIAYYDPESAQSGRKQQIHSISADTVDMYPYNQPLSERGIFEVIPPVTQSNVPAGVHQSTHMHIDAPAQEVRSNMRRKIGVIELPRIPYPEQMTPPPPSGPISNGENNNKSSFTHKPTTNSSSISIDSSPLSIDKLNGSESLGTISARALFTANRRAPLASLSSFRISSLEYQDSEMRSLDEDSVFLESVADTDEDMQQLSSDSEEASINDTHDIAFNVEEKDVLVSGSAEEINSSFDIVPQTSPIPINYSKDICVGVGVPATTAATTSTVHMAGSAASTASARARRSLLQRHRTISVSSSDRVTLLGQQLKEFPSSGTQTSTSSGESRAPIETHFGTVIATNSPPMRRPQLIQQYSDPNSQPTTTTTTTTATADEDTCSTRNTELGGAFSIRDVNVTEVSAAADSYAAIDATTTGSNETVIMGSGGRASATLTQYSSLTTVLSFGRTSPLVDSQMDLDLGNSENSFPTSDAQRDSHQPIVQCLQQQQQQQQQQQNQQQLQKLPISLITDDNCASSISDSYVMHHQPLTDVSPAQNPSAAAATFSQSFTNLSITKADTTVLYAGHHSPSPSVMLELPLIKLPAVDDSSDKSLTSENNVQIKRSSKSKSEGSHYPPLPDSSRKLSHETLF